MGKFDTHGGYFAPDGYMRINAGGSHEENPNGGVQVGVDSQGIPNMLEEGEPVYNDYVYSDNIVIDDGMLEKYNLPKSIKGKLYSEAADWFIDEAAERDGDPVSNNGLEVMLSRLAEAQEEQKRIQQEKDLEDELSRLSPEEMTALVEMMAQQASPEQMSQEVPPETLMPQEAVPMEEVPVQETQPAGLPQMFGGGGFLRAVPKVFAGGGVLDEEDNARRAEEAMNNAAAARATQGAIIALNNAMAAQAAQEAAALAAQERKVKRLQRYVARDEKVARRMEGSAKDIYPADRAAFQNTLLKQYNLVDYNKKRLEEATAALEAMKESQLPDFSDAPQATVSLPSQTAYQQKSTGKYENLDSLLNVVRNMKADGGPVNRFEGGGWEDFLKALGQYSVSRNPGNVSGTYRIDTGFPLAGFATIKDLEDSEAYRNFTDYVLANSDNPNVRRYLQALDAGTADGVQKLFDGDKLVSDWANLYKNRRYDQKGGIYHFSGDDVNALAGLTARRPWGAMIEQVNAPVIPTRVERITPAPALMTEQAGSNNTTSTGSGRPAALPTISRYPWMQGALALYNAVQRPDTYEVGRYTPVLPYGQLNLVDPVYNPIDQNMVVNNVLASSAGTTRGLVNSGLGPSTGAALLTADYNAGRNIGTALAQAREANNQRLNSVIAGRNQNESALSQFNYGMSRDRASILNDAALHNMRNSLLQQQLNYQAEGQKYAAIQQQLDQLSQALAGMGRENVALNQLNYNTALPYMASNNGVSWYTGAKGGLLKKYKK